MSEQNVVERLDRQIARTNVPYAAMGAMKAARAEILRLRAQRQPFDASFHHCHAARDGECNWEHCIQARDGEPKRTGRHCPLYQYDMDGEYLRHPNEEYLRHPRATEPAEEEDR